MTNYETIQLTLKKVKGCKTTSFLCGSACKVEKSERIFIVDLFTTRHKMVHNGGSPNFKGLLFDKRTTYMAQVLQRLSYKVCFIKLPKFTTFGLLILNLDTSAIIDQTACCYNVTTSEIGL